MSKPSKVLSLPLGYGQPSALERIMADRDRGIAQEQSQYRAAQQYGQNTHDYCMEFISLYAKQAAQLEDTKGQLNSVSWDKKVEYISTIKSIIIDPLKSQLQSRPYEPVTKAQYQADIDRLVGTLDEMQQAAMKFQGEVMMAQSKAKLVQKPPVKTQAEIEEEMKVKQLEDFIKQMQLESAQQNKVLQEKDQALADKDQSLAEKDQIILKQQTEIHDLTQTVHHERDLNQDLTAKLIVSEEVNAELRGVVVVKEEEIAELRVAVVAKEEENADLRSKLVESEENIVAFREKITDLSVQNHGLKEDKQMLLEDKIELREDKKLLLADKKMLHDLNAEQRAELLELRHVHFETAHCTIVGHCNNPDHGELQAMGIVVVNNDAI